MGNIDDCNSLRLEIPDHFYQNLNSDWERVEDGSSITIKFRITGKGFHNLCQLPLPHIQRRYPGLRINFYIQFICQALRLLIYLLRVNPAQGISGVIVYIDIFSHRQFIKKRQFLVITVDTFYRLFCFA